jgi:hypothetical protein
MQVSAIGDNQDFLGHAFSSGQAKTKKALLGQGFLRCGYLAVVAFVRLVPETLGAVVVVIDRAGAACGRNAITHFPLFRFLFLFLSQLEREEFALILFLHCYLQLINESQCQGHWSVARR